jgi:hypothetical protein
MADNSIYHLASFIILFFALSVACDNKLLLLLCLLILPPAGEFIQLYYCKPFFEFEIVDIICNLSGALVGLISGLSLKKHIPGKGS